MRHGAEKASVPFGAASAPSLPNGSYARWDVELGATRASAEAFELALALPFGALFSALLPARPFRIRELSLDYVAPERLGSNATYSAKVVEPLGAGQGGVELRLLVSCGAWACVRGRAVLELSPAPDRAVASGSGEGHWNGSSGQGERSKHG